MRLSVRQVKAFHRQIDRLDAAAELRMLSVVAAGFASGKSFSELARTLQERVRAEEEKPIVISNNAELKAWMNRGGR